MPVNVHDFIKILAEIFDDSEIKNTMTCCAKGGAITGVAAVIGGLLLGPRGLAIGGAIGALTAAMTSENKFKSISEILLSMEPHQKKKLCDRVKYAFRNFGASDLTAIAALIMSQESFKELAVKEVRNFLTSDMNVILGS